MYTSIARRCGQGEDRKRGGTYFDFGWEYNAPAIVSVGDDDQAFNARCVLSASLSAVSNGKS